MTRPFTEADIDTAFEIVSQLARGGILEADDASMEREAARQREGVSMFEDFYGNFHEELDDIFASGGGIAAIVDENDMIPEIDLDEIRGISSTPQLDPVSITLELACQQIRTGEILNDDEIEIEGGTLNAGVAIDIVGALWERYGREIQENITVIALPVDFFKESEVPEI